MKNDVIKLKDLPKVLNVRRTILEGYSLDDWDYLLEKYKNNSFIINDNIIEPRNEDVIFKPLYPKQIDGVVTLRIYNAIFTPLDNKFIESKICRPVKKEMTSFGWITTFNSTKVKFEILKNDK